MNQATAPRSATYVPAFTLAPEKRAPEVHAPPTVQAPNFINDIAAGRVELPTIPAVVQRLIDVADREGVPLQHESSSRYSGTDTDVIFTSRSGIPAALVSVPMRYMHSTVETVDLGDVAHTVALLAAFIRSVRTDDTFRTDVLG